MGDIILKGNLHVDGTVRVTDDVCIGGILSVEEEVTFGSNVFIDTSIFIGGELSVDGDVTLSSTLHVSSNAYFAQDVTVGHNIITSNISVENSINFSNVTISDLGINYSNDSIMLFSSNLLTLVQPVEFLSNVVIPLGYLQDENGASYSTGGGDIDSESINTSNITTSNLNTSNVFTDNIVASNISTSNIDTDSLTTDELIVNGVRFPVNPTEDDKNKILTINSNGDYELMTVFEKRQVSDFSYLYGIKSRNTEFVSGLFDYGVPNNWMDGWKAYTFDAVNVSGYDTSSYVLPTDSSSASSTIISSRLIASSTTNRFNFTEYINFPMVNHEVGYRHNSGILVSDGLNCTDYYFFIGTIIPDSIHFANKVHRDYRLYYNTMNNYNHGYSVYLDTIEPTKYIRMPHDDLYMQYSMFFTIEFINTYDNSPNYADISVDNSDKYKFSKPSTIENRREKYYRYYDIETNTINYNNKGLYPYITYKSWLNKQNSNEMSFQDKLYDDKIWGDMTLNDYNRSSNFYNLHGGDSSNDWMFILYKLTYNYIQTGMTQPSVEIDNDLIYTYFETNIVDKSYDNYNLEFHSNINYYKDVDDYILRNNINSVCYSSNAFPIEIFQ